MNVNECNGMAVSQAEQLANQFNKVVTVVESDGRKLPVNVSELITNRILVKVAGGKIIKAWEG